MPTADGTRSPAPPLPQKLLIFAGVPPPVHGQSVMVSALLQALRNDPGFAVFHINPSLSKDSTDVGHARLGKLFSLLRACVGAWKLRCAEGRMLFYYVPAPGRRVPVFRDWIVMACLRPFFGPLVLHWHAVGLGRWTAEQSGLVRKLTRALVGEAELAIVLAPELAEDAAIFRPKQIVPVANGIPDPLRGAALPPRAASQTTHVLFLGLGSEEKGLFRTAEAVLLANRGGADSFQLTFAGVFPSREEERRFAELAAEAKGTIRYAGFANEPKKNQLLAEADLLCFPTTYAHEGQPLVLLEALAFDLPIITTRWRAIPGMLPQTPHVHYVDPAKSQDIAEALLAARASTSPEGAHRRHFLEHFTLGRHLGVVTSQLQKCAGPK